MMLQPDYGRGTVPAGIAALRAHALRDYPREACGLLLDDGAYVACRNLAADDDDFRLPDEVWLEYEGRIVAVAHSHCAANIHAVPWGRFPDAPSEADLRYQDSVGLPYGIVLTDGQRTRGPFFWGGGVRSPLLGRRWRHGVTDCYALVRDWYKAARRIELPQIPRAPGWEADGAGLLAEMARRLPMVRIGRAAIEVDDVLLFGRHGKPEDMAVYLGGGKMLSQYHDGLSRTESVSRWMPLFVGAYRWQA